MVSAEVGFSIDLVGETGIISIAPHGLATLAGDKIGECVLETKSASTLRQFYHMVLLTGAASEDEVGDEAADS